MALAKNPDYYAAKDIKLSEVRLLMSENPTAAYMNKEVDWVGGGGVESVDYASFDNATYRNVNEAPYASTYYYQFNLNKAPFNNLKIRKALAMAIDREGLLYGNPAFGFVPPTIHGTKLNFRSEMSDKANFTENIAAAKELLKEGLREAGLTELPEFTIIVNEDNNHEVIARKVIDGWYKNLGIEANVESQSWPELLDNRKNQNFTIARAGWTADFNDPASMLGLFTSWSPDNDTGWSDKVYDGYMKQAQQTTDTGTRMQIYAKAEKLLMDQMVVIPLFYSVTDLLSNPGIKNVYVDYDGSIAFTRGAWK